MDASTNESKPAPLVALYRDTVLRVPWLFVLITAGFAAFFGYYTKDFKLDASSESIVLENDPDLRYYNETRDIFGSDDYIIVTVTPDDDLFSEANLATLKRMSDEFVAMDDVESVTSILNVPLFHSPPIQFAQMATDYTTLLEDADVEMAREELTTSPLYSNYLISIDGKTTAMQVTFRDPPEDYQNLSRERRDLRDKRRDESLSPEESARLSELNEEYAGRYAEQVAQNSVNIEKVREIVGRYRSEIGELYLGGVPMIMADIISYVENDIQTFGIGVTLLVIVVLASLFRKPKWILLPTITCVLTVLFMMGYLGYTHWSATIVTSNFPSILVVITMAMAIHIVVRYRELYARFPDKSNRDLILETIRQLAIPCFYTSLTTMVGFSSLTVSGIRPVMDFGMMMTMGIGIAYALIFLFLPAALYYFPKGAVPPKKLADLKDSPLRIFARFTERSPKAIYATAFIIFAVSAYGTTLLEVENRFIDYFREDTEIYVGMTVIDQRLGGTTPLEVVVEAEGKDFWLKMENRAKMREIHTWLDALPETGKVISPDTMLRMAESVWDSDDPIPTPLITLMLARIPKDILDAVATPYITPERDQIRFAMRAQETSRDLSRKELIAKIENYYATAEVFKDANITPRTTGVFVLYNNMLQSLFNSQIKTIVMVFGAIWLMFLVLFRSIRLATIGIIPNILPVILVLGTLGLSGIPLDLMTIMTAAITLGIAVDFAIHYIHRFKMEYKKDSDYVASMYRCHNSIGRAMYFTTITIIAGFSILAFSNFIPSVYFGLFTSLALVVAFLASVTLLPLLIITWKPLGRNAASTETEEAA